MTNRKFAESLKDHVGGLMRVNYGSRIVTKDGPVQAEKSFILVDVDSPHLLCQRYPHITEILRIEPNTWTADRSSIVVYFDSRLIILDWASKRNVSFIRGTKVIE